MIYVDNILYTMFCYNSFLSSSLARRSLTKYPVITIKHEPIKFYIQLKIYFFMSRFMLIFGSCDTIGSNRIGLYLPISWKG